jgi:pSer/pThr/pTyr-binding forkhead associated (FHA) protein
MEKVTMRALEKNVKDRYPTAKEMGRALGYTKKSDATVSAATPVGASLVVLDGPQKGNRIPLAGVSRDLGRSDLDTSNTAISRRHATILFRGGGYWLRDNSKNGTWVDNQRVYGEMPLQTGSMIAIGDSVLRLEATA